ncbi:cytochrome-c peroxidase [Glaciecola petra]|uniref:Cytochrome c peroxidase n=1 Tax=Glaciecola petra TaxID=3075602 RepID=A0ABU2ZL32_9ALTE|nr:cytochrome c peroxidase [Aestuariibacter sp. P117]MDT0593326.1 cytochrome c peroxidase [Aestuariibacter sp. P117]
MKLKHAFLLFILVFLPIETISAQTENEFILEAGHESLQVWLLPKTPESPADNQPNAERIELGKKLFFDPRLSGAKNMSCATCHNPVFGWSDGLPTALGNKSMVLGRASPTVVNTGYNSIQMWDGRKATLEDQALGPMKAHEEMNMDLDALIKFMSANEEYSAHFKRAYPDTGVSEASIAKAIAAFERTIISRTSPFDKWVAGDESALSPQQINGFKVFLDPEKGNCSVCHQAPNFTDNGFHNLGLASYGKENPDMGRYTQRPLRLMKGAFKTPTMRDIALTAPYFHDGSAANLREVVEHYQSGGVIKTNIAPNFTAAKLSDQEVDDLIAFMQALSSPQAPFTLPILPLEH